MIGVCKNLLKALPKSIVRMNSSFSSHVALKRLYPESNSNLVTPKFQKGIESTENQFSGFIPIDKLQITYSRSSGPGGQNVNMVNSKVDVRFHVETADWINDELKNKIKSQYKNKITNEGFIIIRSEKTRSQQLNLADALEKIRAMIWSLTDTQQEVSPETEQQKLRRQEKAARIRLAEKRTRSRVKEGRQSPMVDL